MDLATSGALDIDRMTIGAIVSTVVGILREKGSAEALVASHKLAGVNLFKDIIKLWKVAEELNVIHCVGCLCLIDLSTIALVDLDRLSVDV